MKYDAILDIPFSLALGFKYVPDYQPVMEAAESRVLYAIIIDLVKIYLVSHIRP